MNKLNFESLAIRDSEMPEMAHLLPIFASSTFVYESPEKIMRVFKHEEEAFVYSRWDNPTIRFVEKKIAALSSYNSNIDAKSLLFGSGMAAITTLINSIVKVGDKIVSQGNIYGASVEFLDYLQDQKGIEVIYIDMHDLELLKKETKGAKLVYIESPSNPTINAYDIAQIAEISHSNNCKLAIDNTFSTPYLQRPLIIGADYVLHSATKYLNGHGTSLTGVIVCRDNESYKKFWNGRKLYGGVCSPFDAWLLNNGLKTLVLRMEKHCDNAEQVANFLSNRSEVISVNYLSLTGHPDHQIASKQMHRFGGVLSFELEDGLQAGIKLMQNIRFCTLTSTLGTPDTLITHPASMTHVNVDESQRLKFGISDGLIRMSVGLENINDITEDLAQALDSLN